MLSNCSSTVSAFGDLFELYKSEEDPLFWIVIAWFLSSDIHAKGDFNAIDCIILKKVLELFLTNDFYLPLI